MNVKPKYLIRSLATTLVALLVLLTLIGCSTVEQGIPSSGMTAPEVVSTPTGSIELLATPTLAATSTTVPQEGHAPTTTSTLPPDWVRESYGGAWTIGYPASWTVHAAGAHEGALQLQGEYEGHSYVLTLSYPIGQFPDTLEAWVNEMLLPLPLERREDVVISDVAVGNTPAKKVLNVMTSGSTLLAHYVYLWRNETKNPRLITLTQNDGQPVDSLMMEKLLDQLILFTE